MLQSSLQFCSRAVKCHTIATLTDDTIPKICSGAVFLLWSTSATADTIPKFCSGAVHWSKTLRRFGVQSNCILIIVQQAKYQRHGPLVRKYDNLGKYDCVARSAIYNPVNLSAIKAKSITLVSENIWVSQLTWKRKDKMLENI